MYHKLTEDELNKLDNDMLKVLFLNLQEQYVQLQESMNRIEEQLRIANNHRFGRHTETRSEIEGQLSIFDEAESSYDSSIEEPEPEEIIPKKKRRSSKGKQEADLKDLPVENIPHPVSDEDADAYFGKGCWRRFSTETYKKLRYTPASWTVELHQVDVIVGNDGLHQDEFLRGKHPKGLLVKSLLTPSLAAAIFNGKFGNAFPFYRIENEFRNFGVNISRQTMCNWTMAIAERYFKPMYEYMKKQLLLYPVNQADETPVLVIHDGRPTPSKSWMWVHRTGEFNRDGQIVLYEYQKTRHHDYPEEFYKDYNGILVTDALQQYHMLEKSNPNITSANCWVHGRRMMVDATKAMKKDDPEKVRKSVAYQTIVKISQMYEIEGSLKDLPADERKTRRQSEIAPLVEDFFAWLRQMKAQRAYLPKTKTGQGVEYFLNQEKYLRVFLTNGDVPMDNSASERSIRPFTIGRKNWLFNNTNRGAQASAMIYSVVETAKANNLKPYQYLNHLLTELPELADDKGNIDETKLAALMPWAKELPDECRKTGC